MLGLLGYLFPAELAGLLAGLEGFGGFEAWQTAALNAYKRSHCCGRGVLLSHCCGLVVAFACESARVGLVGVPVPCGAGRTFGGFGGFWSVEAWQTAALNAYKKPLLRPWGALEPLLWPCGALRAGVARVGLVGVPFPCGAGRDFWRVWRVLEGLRPGKRQP